MRLAAALLIALLPAVAQAQVHPCSTYDKISAGLKAKYQERRRVSMVSRTQITEIWVNERTQTWTLLAVNVHGLACIRASGKGVMWMPEGERT